jgi:hypothetical protein
LCVLNSLREMKPGCSVQNAQCGYTGAVLGKAPYMCVHKCETHVSEKWEWFLKITASNVTT